MYQGWRLKWGDSMAQGSKYTDEQKEQLLSYSDGDYVLLTSENSRGFVEGIYQSIDIVNSLNSGAKERSKG